MSGRVTFDTSLGIFQYKVLNNVLISFLNVKLLLHLFVLLVILKMNPVYTFFTLAMKQNLFALNYKSF